MEAYTFTFLNFDNLGADNPKTKGSFCRHFTHNGVMFYIFLSLMILDAHVPKSNALMLTSLLDKHNAQLKTKAAASGEETKRPTRLILRRLSAYQRDAMLT